MFRRDSSLVYRVSHRHHRLARQTQLPGWLTVPWRKHRYHQGDETHVDDVYQVSIVANGLGRVVQEIFTDADQGCQLIFGLGCFLGLEDSQI